MALAIEWWVEGFSPDCSCDWTLYADLPAWGGIFCLECNRVVFAWPTPNKAKFPSWGVFYGDGYRFRLDREAEVFPEDGVNPPEALEYDGTVGEMIDAGKWKLLADGVIGRRAYIEGDKVTCDKMAPLAWRREFRKRMEVGLLVVAAKDFPGFS